MPTSETATETVQSHLAAQVQTTSDKTSVLLAKSEPQNSEIVFTNASPIMDGLLPPPPIQPVTCPEDGLILPHYPWKLKPKIVIEHLTSIEVDIWSNKVREYCVHIASSNTVPIITDVKGYGLRTRPVKIEPDTPEPTKENIKTEQLMDQAHALIDKAKKFVTKPVHSKHSRKRPST